MKTIPINAEQVLKLVKANSIFQTYVDTVPKNMGVKEQLESAASKLDAVVQELIDKMD